MTQFEDSRHTEDGISTREKLHVHIPNEAKARLRIGAKLAQSSLPPEHFFDLEAAMHLVHTQTVENSVAGQDVKRNTYRVMEVDVPRLDEVLNRMIESPDVPDDLVPEILAAVLQQYTVEIYGYTRDRLEGITAYSTRTLIASTPGLSSKAQCIEAAQLHLLRLTPMHTDKVLTYDVRATVATDARIDPALN